MHKATSYMQNIADILFYDILLGGKFAIRNYERLTVLPSAPLHLTNRKNKKVLPVPPLLMLFLAKEEEALI